MKAKDTVMDDKEMVQAITDNPNIPMGQALIKKQAEITWPIAEQAGMKKVVEWIRRHENKGNVTVEWQAALEGWGL